MDGRGEVGRQPSPSTYILGLPLSPSPTSPSSPLTPPHLPPSLPSFLTVAVNRPSSASPFPLHLPSATSLSSPTTVGLPLLHLRPPLLLPSLLPSSPDRRHPPSVPCLQQRSWKRRERKGGQQAAKPEEEEEEAAATTRGRQGGGGRRAKRERGLGGGGGFAGGGVQRKHQRWVRAGSMGGVEKGGRKQSEAEVEAGLGEIAAGRAAEEGEDEVLESDGLDADEVGEEPEELRPGSRPCLPARTALALSPPLSLARIHSSSSSRPLTVATSLLQSITPFRRRCLCLL